MTYDLVVRIDFHSTFLAVERQTELPSVSQLQVKRFFPGSSFTAVLHTMAESVSQAESASHYRIGCCGSSVCRIVAAVEFMCLYCIAYSMRFVEIPCQMIGHITCVDVERIECRVTSC